MNEIEAIRKTKEGDRDAFEYLYRNYCSKVYQFTRLYITSTHDAEEIVQEVFLKLWEVHHLLDETKSFSGFLFIITRNIIFNLSRKSFNESFYKLTILETLEEDSYDLEEELEASDLHEYINNLLETLPERQQEIFKLSRNHQLTYKEIAAQLNISEKIVEHNISNTLKFLKKNLQLYTLFIA